MRIALALMAALLFLAPAAHAQAPWETARKVKDGLFDAQTELVLSGTGAASNDPAPARQANAGERQRRQTTRPAPARRPGRGSSRPSLRPIPLPTTPSRAGSRPRPRRLRTTT